MEEAGGNLSEILGLFHFSEVTKKKGRKREREKTILALPLPERTPSSLQGLTGAQVNPKLGRCDISLIPAFSISHFTSLHKEQGVGFAMFVMLCQISV